MNSEDYRLSFNFNSYLNDLFSSLVRKYRKRTNERINRKKNQIITTKYYTPIVFLMID